MIKKMPIKLINKLVDATVDYYLQYINIIADTAFRTGQTCEKVREELNPILGKQVELLQCTQEEVFKRVDEGEDPMNLELISQSKDISHILD